MRLLILLPWLLGVSLGVLAHPGKHTLEELVVKGQLMLPEQSAFSTTQLTQETIREHSYANTDELFRLVPGMAVRNFQLGGVAN